MKNNIISLEPSKNDKHESIKVGNIIINEDKISSEIKKGLSFKDLLKEIKKASKKISSRIILKHQLAKMPNSYLLLDSCIVEYWLDKSMELVVSDQIKKWLGSKNEIALSEITYSELIDGAHKIKEE